MWGSVTQNPRHRWRLRLENAEAGEATEHTHLPAAGEPSQRGRGAADRRGLQDGVTTERPWGKTGGQPPREPLSLNHSEESGSSDQEDKGSRPGRNSHSFAQFPYLSQCHTQNLLNEETSSPGRGGHHTTVSVSCPSSGVPSANSATGEE